MLDVKQLEQRITELGNHERMTKELLGSLSRDLLVQFKEDNSVALINMLLGCDEEGRYILTPMNWRRSVEYFYSFIPHASNWSDLREGIVNASPAREPMVFGKRAKNRVKKIGNSLEEFLLTDQTIWEWTPAAGKAAVKAPSIGKLAKLIGKVMEEAEADGQDIKVTMQLIDTELQKGGYKTANQILELMAEQIPAEEEQAA